MLQHKSNRAAQPGLFGHAQVLLLGTYGMIDET
jgi:hypothetical protein